MKVLTEDKGRTFEEELEVYKLAIKKKPSLDV